MEISDEWYSSELFDGMTPLFKWQDEYKHALKLAKPHSITYKNISGIFKIYKSRKKLEYIYLIDNCGSFKIKSAINSIFEEDIVVFNEYTKDKILKYSTTDTDTDSDSDGDSK